jgi:tetratricopeptide (TPR) repeat protein
LGNKEEDIFADRINKIIPLLNGYDPKTLLEKEYGPSQLEKNKIFGPKAMTKDRYLVLLYIGKRISTLKALGEEIGGLIYFSAPSIKKIANYRRFDGSIDYHHNHAIEKYLKYRDESFIDYRSKEKTKRGGRADLVALTTKGEQYCKDIIDGLIHAAAEKVSVEGKTVQSPSQIITSDFDKVQKELYNSYGLIWLARDYFESHKSSSLHLDDWRRGFEFDLPSIKSRQELRREGIIRDIKTKLENEKKILIVGPSGSSKSTILMELMCDYFDASYEIFHNKGLSEGVKNTDGLVNFIESRLKLNEKILVAIDDAHSERMNSIFYVLDKLSNSDLTKHLRFVITARLPEFTWLLHGLDKVQEELRKSIRKLTGDVNLFYHIPYFTKEEIRDFIKLYLEDIDHAEADKKCQEVYDYTMGDPIMVKFAVLGQGLERDIEEMNDRYLRNQLEMKTMLICSLLDISVIPITDSILERCGVLESAYHLNKSVLYRNAEGIWRTKHLRWDMGLFSFLYGNNTRMILSSSRKQDLKDSLLAIYEMGEDVITYLAVMALYDMVRLNFLPIKLFEVIFKESILHKPMYLSKEKISSIFVLISEAYYVHKEFQHALDSSNEAIKWNLRNAYAYDKKGIALTYLKRDDEAVEYFDKALDIDLGLASAWMHKGNALDFLGHHKEALECYDKALEIDQYYLTLLVSINKGGCFYNMEKYKEAIECFDKVLNIINSEQFPNLLILLEFNERGRLLYQINSYESQAYRLKGTCLSELGKYEEAMKCIDKALEIDPNNTYTWYEKGNALFGLRKYEAAIDAYGELLKIDPGGWLDVWIRKAALHALLNNNKEAVDCYDRALKINSDLAEIWFLKGQALLRLARSDDARYCQGKAKELGFNISSLKKK